MVSTLQAQPPVTRNNGPNYEPRLVFPQMKKSGDLGVRLVTFLVHENFMPHLHVRIVDAGTLKGRLGLVRF